MKKSFAENCIRYISTATALILALAMLCCANFSASAKDLGSNLTITDTTLLLQDINTTTNTTPAKTKDLIASGANVDVVSTSANEFNQQYLYVDLSSVSATMNGINHYWDTGCTNYYGWQTTFDSLGNSVYRFDLSQAGTTSYLYFRGFQIVTSLGSYKIGVGTDTTKNCVKMTSGTSGSWTTYSVTTSYTVTFHANGHGTAPVSQTVNSGETVTEPTAPTETGYTFGGWYTDSACTNKYNFSTAVTANITLYAKWTAISTTANNRYYVKVYTSKTDWWNNSGCDHVAELSGGTKITLKAVKNDNTASNVNGNIYYFDVPTSSTDTSFKLLRCTPGTQDQFSGNNTNFISFVAGKNYLSEFQQNSTTATWGNYTPITISGDTECDVDSTITLTATKTTICPDDITGISWKSSDDAIATVNASGVVTGVSEGEVTITAYNTTNENIFATYKVKINTNIVTYTVSFDANGHGTAPSAQTVIENESATEPTPAPIATGYTFGGWYTDENCTEVNKYNFNTPVTGNITLYAKWTANEYTVTFDYKDGTTTSTTKVVTYNEAYGELPNPTRENYNFGGWYLEEEFTNEVTSTKTVTTADNHTLYAKWTAKEYNITYVLNDGTINGDYATKYTYGVGATLPTDVTKDGYTFLGWKDDVTGDIVTEISTTDSGNKSFTAQWKLNTFEHQYVFLDASGCDWFYDNKCVGVVYFNNDNVAKTTTGYTEMKELFTDDSGYESGDGKAQHSKLLFAEVPSGTTKITFARHGSGDYNNNYNITNFGYSNFTTNNCFKITGGGNNDSSVSGTWSEKTYNPVPIDFSVVGNGSVAFKNTVSPEITVSNGGTIYADKASTALKVKATPSENYEVSVFTVFTINSEDKLGSITDKSAGGTVDVGALGDTNTVEVTFIASQSPKIKVIPVANSSIRLSYTDPDGTYKIGTEFDTEYEIQYNSSFTLEITPASGYYVQSVSKNLTPTDTLPKAGTITATATQVKENLTLSYTLEKNPTVTIECYDSTGEKITSGVGITVDGGTEALTSQKKTVLYNDSTGATFTASANDEHQYKFLGYYTTTTPVGSPIESGGIDDYDVTVDGNSIKVYHVKSDITLYAIFSQQYKVTFNYENLTNFTVDGTAVATGGSVYVSSGANLTLVATISDDYKLTNDFWSITPTDIGTFTSNGLSATYVSGSGDVTITIKPEIATYTGQGKWGSKTLKIDTSGVKKDTPWFAAKFATSSSGTTYTWVRFSKMSDDSYECVVPDGYDYVRFCRMATNATTFTDTTTDDINATTAWNITDSFISLGKNSSEYTLAFVDGEKSKITATKK